MPAGSVDLVITSPPYNIRNSTGNGLKDGRGGKWENAALNTATRITTIACRMRRMSPGSGNALPR